MLLRLVDPIEIPSLLFRQRTMDVLLENLEVTGHCVQRRSEFVAQPRKELSLDAIRRFRVLPENDKQAIVDFLRSL